MNEKNKALKFQCTQGNLQAVKDLLADPQLDPCAGDNWDWGLTRACEYGNIEIVKELLQHHKINVSYAIAPASGHNHIEIVRILLQDERVDPSENDKEAIKWAALYGHLEVVHLLWNESRVLNSLTDTDIGNIFSNIMSNVPKMWSTDEIWSRWTKINGVK